MTKPEDKLTPFLAELRELLNEHGVTIENHTSFDSTSYYERFSLEGPSFEVDLAEVLEQWERDKG
jgi:hypothetical protein